MYHNPAGMGNPSGAMGTRRALGVDTSLILMFIATSFLYLLVGLIFFALDLAGVLGMERDAIFVLWLFGFVAMIIFGLSYMFSSGLTRSSAFMNRTVSKEFVLINIGIIGFFSGFSGILPVSLGKPFALGGLASMILAVSLHLMNLVLVATSRRTATKVERQSFGDDY